MLFYVKTKTESLKCIWRVLLHHFLVVLVGEVEHRLHDFELVEDLVVSRHVGGQNAPADGNIHGTVKRKRNVFIMEEENEDLMKSHLIIPPRICLYCSDVRFFRMLHSG